MTKDEALTLAHAALENHSGNYKLTDAECDTQEAVVTAIKEALAQPEQDRCTHGVWIADHCYKCALAQEQGLFVDLIAKHKGLAEELAKMDLEPQPAQDRCTHGVWIADHCYKCALALPTQPNTA